MKKSWITVVMGLLIALAMPAFSGTVSLVANLNGAKNPSVVGTTTLPEGTRLAIDLTCPLMYCDEFRSFSTDAVVHDGIFVSRPIINHDGNVPSDGYVINVVVLHDQDDAVISKLKAEGWNGNQVIAFHSDRPPTKVESRSPQNISAVDVETFTPQIWRQANGDTPWVDLGQSESKAFFYTFVAKDYRTFLNVKIATRGAGDDFILLEFVSAQLDCRPGQPYPAALVRPMTYSYRGDGAFMADIHTLPGDIPIEHGTVLAKAVVGACDSVRQHSGIALAH